MLAAISYKALYGNVIIGSGFDGWYIRYSMGLEVCFSPDVLLPVMLTRTFHQRPVPGVKDQDLGAKDQDQDKDVTFNDQDKDQD